MDLTGSFGYLVHRKRKALDMTQEDLALRAGCSLATIRKIERDLRRPSKQIADLLADALEVNEQDRACFKMLARAERSHPRLPPTSNKISSSNSLPRLLTSFVGREQEIDRLLELLVSDECRLITLLGPGGIGKTRLSIQLVDRMINRQPQLFSDGAFFVSLASANAVELIPLAVAEALGFTLFKPREPKYQIINYLKNKQLLIILDNMEHLLDGADLILEILQSAPEVKILATSREALKMQCEWIFQVEGLPVPLKGQHTGLELNSSVALFLQRAGYQQPGFTLSPGNAESVSRICRFLEGMPLGIELAAAWVKELPVDEIAGEIESSLDFLTASSRDIPLRQQSLRAVIGQSWRMLSEEEQKVMRQLAVFRGGFNRLAAQKVAGASVSMLSHLMRKSLIRRTEEGRYSIHELVAQYALDHLAHDSNEEAETRTRHSNFILIQVKESKANLLNEFYKRTRDDLTSEMGNIRAAWDWALDHKQFGRIRGAASAMLLYHEFMNLTSEGESLFCRTLDIYQLSLTDPAAIKQEEGAVLGALLGHLAFLTFRTGNTQKALELIEQSLEYLRKYGCKQDMAEVFWHFGSVYWLTGRYDQAMRISQESLALYQELGWKWEAAVQEICIGGVLHSLGNYSEALDVLMNSVKISREIREPRGIVTAISILCHTLEVFGHFQQMRELLSEAVAISRENNDRFGLGLALERLATEAYAAGACDEALRFYEEASAIFRDIGDPWGLSSTLTRMGQLYRKLNQIEPALSCYQEAFRTAVESQLPGYSMEACVGIAEIKTIQGDFQDALRLAKEVFENPATTYEARSRAEQLIGASKREYL